MVHDHETQSLSQSLFQVMNLLRIIVHDHETQRIAWNSFVQNCSVLRAMICQI